MSARSQPGATRSTATGHGSRYALVSIPAAARTTCTGCISATAASRYSSKNRDPDGVVVDGARQSPHRLRLRFVASFRGDGSHRIEEVRAYLGGKLRRVRIGVEPVRPSRLHGP